MWIEKESDEELMKGYNKYSNALVSAKMGDKRRYNTKMDITFNSAMLSLYDKEMRDRGLIK